jgi:hypothetical protein
MCVWSESATKVARSYVHRPPAIWCDPNAPNGTPARGSGRLRDDREGRNVEHAEAAHEHVGIERLAVLGVQFPLLLSRSPVRAGDRRVRARVHAYAELVGATFEVGEDLWSRRVGVASPRFGANEYE